MKFERSSGVLLHPISFPGKFGIGDLGVEAYNFVDFLINSGQKLWQVLPLGPTGYGDSPYQCFSAFAGNPLLINVEELKKDGLLSQVDIEVKEKFDTDKVDYQRVMNFKLPLFKKAFKNFKNKKDFLAINKFDRFCEENSDWLNDYALFRAVKSYFGERNWSEWEDREIVIRESQAIEKYKEMLAEEIEFRKFKQYLFFKQWCKIKNYANANGIKIIGDIPIFIAFDSSDAWANPDLFEFDEDRKPVKVAGVPPDYFSENGQLWGNPIYNWEKMKENGFEWWIERIKANLKTADIIRIDHFRGFAQFWGVPYGETTAINGKWFDSPGMELFEAIRNSLGKLPIIAEDLGIITPDVDALREKFSFPGMKILQFAFDPGDDENHLPYIYDKDIVVYTGTHDNNTVVGWYKEAPERDRKFAKDYLNIRHNRDDIEWDFIRVAWSSVADIAIVPVQDLLGLDGSARMNVPSTSSGNWQWRYKKGDLNRRVSDKLRKLTKLYFR